MELVQVLLPVYDDEGEAFDGVLYTEVRRTLTERFGGITAYVRAPASGSWKEDDGTVVRDDIVVYEVMVEDLEPEWWRAYRETLRRRFRQDEIIVRALPIRML